jgi:hypothetical protein
VALADLRPDAVLVEGPPEAERVLALARHEEMEPPVALLVWAVDDPRRAVFYPLAVFSPEWQAIRYAVGAGVTLRMIDLPLTHVLAAREPEEIDPASPETPSPAPPEGEWLRRDPIAWLAEAAGHGDPERFWEDVVEHRRGEQAFAAIADAMAALRETAEAAEADGPALAGRERRAHEARREAHMRQAIRRALKEGHERVAVVCGAWHAPALAELGPAKPDLTLLKGLSRRKVAVTWIPWTYDRLSYRSGYGAGVLSPGWYEHLYHHQGEEVLARWLTKTARLLREQDLDVSSAHVIDAVRLADALASLRMRPLAGLPELTDATRAILGDGADTALALVHEKLIVGEVLGSVPAEAPTVPLQADLEREQRRLRLRPQAGFRTLDLDLRQENDRGRSRLLHRLELLGIQWGLRETVRGARGTFHELWQLQWQPEYAVRLIEASRYGSTVFEAATTLVRERAADDAALPVLTGLVEAALLADLPAAVEAAMDAFQQRAALAGDATVLMDALPPLARVLRYGNVRATDARQVAGVVDGLVARIVVGLPLAAAALDDGAAEQLHARIDAVDAAIGMLERDDLRQPWREALGRLAERDDVHGRVVGRANRILHDAGALDAGEVARRVGRTLSPANDPAAGATWIEGFLTGSGLVLLHDQALLGLIDRWLVEVRDEPFRQLLPVLRRTFSEFPAGERRQIGARLKRLDASSAAGAADAGDPEPLDHERAALVLPVLRLIVAGEEIG